MQVCEGCFPLTLMRTCCSRTRSPTAAAGALGAYPPTAERQCRAFRCTCSVFPRLPQSRKLGAR
eukprot:4862894-Pleurochrysis_carterae.AAC.1